MKSSRYWHTVFVTPKSKMEMMEELKKPVFSAAELQRTKSELGFTIRPRAYKDYYEHMDEYRRRFIKRLDIIAPLYKYIIYYYLKRIRPSVKLGGTKAQQDVNEQLTLS